MSDDQMTWRAAIAEEASVHGDDIDSLIVYPETVMWPRSYWRDHTPEDGATEQSTLDVEFDGGYGSSCGPAFTAWSANRVYFPVVYDGAESAGSAPRNPSEDATEHVGGQ